MINPFPFGIFIFITSTYFCEAAKVQFFELSGFQGYPLEETSSANCKNLPTDHQNLNGSIKTQGCIMVYPERDCYSTGFIVRGQQSILWVPQHSINFKNYLKYTVSSFKDCSPIQNGDKLVVGIYRKQNRKDDIIANFGNVCECYNLPKSFIGWKPSADLHGKCVKVYRKEDCKGKQWIKYGEHDTIDFRIENWDGFYDIRSLQPCSLSAFCENVNLTAIVFKIVPDSDTPEIPTGNQQATILGKQTFTNNGNAELEKIFRVSEEIEEVSQTELSASLSVMTSIGYSISNEASVKAEVPGVGSVSDKVTSTLSAGLQTQVGTEGRKSNAVHIRKKVGTEETVKVPPCTKLDYWFTVKMAKAVEVNFKMQMRVSGTRGLDTRMSAEEIRKHLKDVKYLRNEDEFTVIVEGDAKLLTSFKLSGNSNSEAEPLLDCKKKFNL